ncbi:MAG: putative signal transducing protein [Terriglobia bacterium]
MAYCPQCRTEYREGTLECMDCHTGLRPGSPPEDVATKAAREPEQKLMRIRVFSGPTSLMQADLAKNLLETEGILCVLPGQVMGEILPGVESIQMLVDERDAERADEILQAYLDNPQVEPAE